MSTAADNFSTARNTGVATTPLRFAHRIRDGCAQTVARPIDIILAVFDRIADGGDLHLGHREQRNHFAQALRAAADIGERNFFAGCDFSGTAENVPRISWLPPTCAYRLVAEDRDLYWWHPLVSGDPDTVHAAGISTRDRTVSEEVVAVADFEDHAVSWPAELPRRARAR